MPLTNQTWGRVSLIIVQFKVLGESGLQVLSSADWQALLLLLHCLAHVLRPQLGDRIWRTFCWGLQAINKLCHLLYLHLQAGIRLIKCIEIVFLSVVPLSSARNAPIHCQGKHGKAIVLALPAKPRASARILYCSSGCKFISSNAKSWCAMSCMQRNAMQYIELNESSSSSAQPSTPTSMLKLTAKLKCSLQYSHRGQCRTRHRMCSAT